LSIAPVSIAARRLGRMITFPNDLLTCLSSSVAGILEP
jgi:hypothetical protein